MDSNISSKIFSARGPLALLGIVLHLCTFYNVSHEFPVTRETHWLPIAAVNLIHAFRMEAFMLIAGLAFAIQIKRDLKLSSFYWNRAKRLTVPFVLTAVFLNYPIYLLFADSSVSRTATLFEAPRLATIMHLWFLRDLCYITVLAGFLYLSTASLKAVRRQSIKLFIQQHQILIICTLPFLLVFPRAMGYMFPLVATISETFGSIESFLRYTMFFFVGALTLYMPIISSSIERPSRIGILGALIFLNIAWAFSSFEFENILTRGFAYAAKQFCTLTLIALAIQCCYRFSTKTKKLLPTLDKASYSIYLLHLPILILVANAIGRANLPVWLDWPLVLVVTSFLCLQIFGISEKLQITDLRKPIRLLQRSKTIRAHD